MGGDDRLSRRQILVGLGVLAVAGAGGAQLLRSDDAEPAGAAAPLPTERDRARTAQLPEPEPTPDPEPTPELTAEPEPEPEPLEPLEPAPAYELVDREVYGEPKLLAAAVAQALTTYAPGEDPAEVIARSLIRPREGIDLAAVQAAASPLVDPAVASRGRVRYPQLGGLAPPGRPTQCSVMVVTEQLLRGREGERTVTRTIDVRLIGAGRAWFVEGVASVGGKEVPRPADLDPLAAAVLDDARIELPDSARWDIHEGIVDPRLLETMLALAEQTPYAVTSLRNGHPEHVFGTERRSNHAVGRAVDVWKIGEAPVVSQQPDEATPAWTVNRLLFEAGSVPELGGPWAFDGFGGRSFTNDVHLDHLHIAFFDPRRDEEPAVPPAEAAPAPDDGAGDTP